MKKILKNIVCVLVSLGSLAVISACQSTPANLDAASLKIKTIHSGTYSYRLIGSEPNNLGGGGKTLIGDDIVWTSETQRIKAGIGVSFGFDFVLNTENPETLETIMITTYPEVIRDKSGRKVTRYAVHKSIFKSGDTRICGYTLENEEELMLGTWTMTVVLGDRVVATKKFILY